jgi:hypothetical protein
MTLKSADDIRHMKLTKKEITECLMLTPLFHELSAQERKTVINYIYSKYGNPSRKVTEKAPKKRT